MSRRKVHSSVSYACPISPESQRLVYGCVDVVAVIRLGSARFGLEAVRFDEREGFVQEHRGMNEQALAQQRTSGVSAWYWQIPLSSGRLRNWMADLLSAGAACQPSRCGRTGARAGISTWIAPVATDSAVGMRANSDDGSSATCTANTLLSGVGRLTAGLAHRAYST